MDNMRIVESGKSYMAANALTNDSIEGYYSDYYREKLSDVTGKVM